MRKFYTTLFVLGAGLICAASSVAQEKVFTMHVSRNDTSLGEITFVLWPEVAPLHADFVEKRVAEGFYNGSAFHRVIPGFMIQGGDPNSISGPKSTWGTGGYPQKVVAEFNARKHVRGVISAARTNDPNSFGGQFFICVATAANLDGQYSAFGQVISGMDVVDVIVKSPRDAANNPLEKISMRIDNPVLSSVQADNQDQQGRVAPVKPLPASTEVEIALSSKTPVSYVRALNSSGVDAGRLLWSQVEDNVVVNTTALVAGVYTLYIEAGKTVSTSRLVIVK